MASPTPLSPRPRADSVRPQHDVVVIGAGFGGLATALRLAELGVDVALCENLRYPGGCASTFSRNGLKFEAGATLFSGFDPGQLFHTWIERHDMDVHIDWLDPIVEMRAPGFHLDVPRCRQTLVERFKALPDAPGPALEAFFDHQRRTADALWALFADPALLPPFGLAALMQHIGRSPSYLPLLNLIGRPLSAVLKRHKLEHFQPLRLYLNALSQITVQANVDEAEAPFALAATDYFFRGTGHVRGGIGTLASAMVDAIRRNGGTVYLANRVRKLEHQQNQWRVSTRGGEINARAVVANLLPQALRTLLELPVGQSRLLDNLSEKVEAGWGAAMLYITARPPQGASDDAHHFELVVDPDKPFIEGNHLFCSISGAADTGRAPDGLRTMTVSTHIPIPKLRSMDDDEQARTIDLIHQRMRQGLRDMLPDWAAGIETEMTASPRTFERFTRRPGGCVGGIPRRYGLHNYMQLTPLEAQPRLYMVGDTVFPGQSTLATAIGGVKVAEAVQRRL